MIDRTLAIVVGADAVAEGASDEEKARLTEFSTEIRTVAEAAAPENALIEEITDAVDKLEARIDRMVASWAPAHPAGEDAAAEGEAEAVDLLEEEPAEEDPAAEAPAAAPAEEAPGEEAPPAEAPAAEAPPAAAPAEAAGG
jgi:hypothetical protein